MKYDFWELRDQNKDSSLEYPYKDMEAVNLDIDDDETTSRTDQLLLEIHKNISDISVTLATMGEMMGKYIASLDVD